MRCDETVKGEQCDRTADYVLVSLRGNSVACKKCLAKAVVRRIRYHGAISVDRMKVAAWVKN